MSLKSAVIDDGGGHDIRATNNPNGSYLAGNGGDDTLRGTRYNDILVGGEGSDVMAGGAGADTFRFYGEAVSLDYLKAGGNDVDKIFDLTFSEGDKLDFTGFGEAAANGVIRSFADLANLVAGSDWTASRQNVNNDNLVIKYDFGDGVSQSIVISNGWNAYIAAGGAIA